MALQTTLTRADILPREQYALDRKRHRQEMVEIKRHRRVAVGPFATFHFESYATMWLQVHEMLYIEKGGAAQIAEELAAYNPLIPQGRELVATMMLGIEDAAERAKILAGLGGIERYITLEVAGHVVSAESESEVERTKADGKTSAVHFLRFRLTDAAITAFGQSGARILLGINHPNYGHIAVVPDSTRMALASDFSG